MKNKFNLLLAILCLLAMALPAHAAKPKAPQQAQKERLVLMPLRIPEEDKSLQGAMETALVEGLQQKYIVFSGEQVAQKAREIFLKESRNTARKGDCDETRCMQNIAEAFQAELIATANVTRKGQDYYLALSIQNIFDNKVEYSKTLTCENCSTVQVVNKLKELTGSESEVAAAQAAQAAEAGRLRLERLQAEQAEKDEQLKRAKAGERVRLQVEQDKLATEIARLKAAAPATALTPGNTGTLAEAEDEITRLEKEVKDIKVRYEKQLEQLRKQINVRYDAQSSGISPRDEFETFAQYQARVSGEKARIEAARQAELAQTSMAELARGETEARIARIAALRGTAYTVGRETLQTELGLYDADKEEFPLKISNKLTARPLHLAARVLLAPAEAKTFKQHWQAGLVEITATAKPFQSPYGWALRDAEASLVLIEGGVFTLPERAAQIEQKKQQIEQKQIEQKQIEQKQQYIRRYAGEMVRIPGKNYELGKYEVTQKEWRDIMGNNPSQFSSCGDTCPVENVSWDDIQTFLQKLNQKTGRQYRLPSEAEWEYACYGGSQSEYCGGNDVDAVAWYGGNSNKTTHPVGQKQANGYGLYDMSGNVWEWMENRYDSSQKERALRGGSWVYSPQYVRSAERDGGEAANRNSDFGFRLARTLP